MARRAIIIGTRRDLFGTDWDVRETRQTRHGFDLYLGWPAPNGETQRGKGFGGPRLIPTRDLYRYWRKRRMSRDNSIYDLPVSRSAAKRVRALLGLNSYLEHRRWWLQRLHDLADLTGASFASKHGVYDSRVSVAHTHFFGPRQRPDGWWREPPASDVLSSGLPHTMVADILGISVGASKRLRHLLRLQSSAAPPVG